MKRNDPDMRWSPHAPSRRPRARLPTVLWPLLLWMALSGCAHDAPRAACDVPDSMFTVRTVAPYPEGPAVSQADLMAALDDTWLGYESALTTIDEIRRTLREGTSQ